jgi:hypothetical protein
MCSTGEEHAGVCQLCPPGRRRFGGDAAGLAGAEGPRGQPLLLKGDCTAAGGMHVQHGSTPTPPRLPSLRRCPRSSFTVAARRSAGSQAAAEVCTVCICFPVDAGIIEVTLLVGHGLTSFSCCSGDLIGQILQLQNAMGIAPPPVQRPAKKVRQKQQRPKRSAWG